jgi:ABC-type transport system involved in cytochrome c biogenesis permease subunit
MTRHWMIALFLACAAASAMSDTPDRSDQSDQSDQPVRAAGRPDPFLDPLETAPALDFEVFRRIPVLQNGRKMPMDTFARQKLLQFSGRAAPGGEPAVVWLARMFFAPETLRDVPLFLVNDPDAAQALGWPAARRSRHSIGELIEAMPTLEDIARKAEAMEPDDRSRVDRELLRLYLNALDFFDLVHSFSFAHAVEPAVVESVELRRALGMPEGPRTFSYLDLHGHSGGLRPLMARVRERPPEDWTDTEYAAFLVAQHLYEWSRHAETVSLVLIPGREEEGDGEVWRSLWSAMTADPRDLETRQAVVTLQELYRAYRRGEQDAFDGAALAFTAFLHARLPGDRDMKWTGLEVAYNDLRPFAFAGIAYLLAFLGALAAVSARGDAARPGRRARVLGGTAVVLCVAGVLLHTSGIVMRMLIMGRPPVTNLYATFVFVAWAGALLGLIVAGAQRNPLGVLIGALCGAALLWVARGFAAEGDTMRKVAAVLSSNLWLSSHVLTIALGYAGCVWAGVTGYVYLIAACIAPRNRARLDAIERAVTGVLVFGLFFTWMGTMLGGIWADQSWGRFWGWDPKENGALLIVLWCAALFQARRAGMVGSIGFAAGAAAGVIFVLLAWLGVNLLGVGLHSYGFTTGLGAVLLAALAVQILLLAILTPIARRRAKKKKGSVIGLCNSAFPND